jgi:hypothetical protein
MIMRTALLILAASFAGSPAMAQIFNVPARVVAGGGGASAGGTYALDGTVGQPADAGNVSSGGAYAVAGGYWQTIDILKTVVPFIDSELTPGSSVIRAIHILELRQRIDALRARFGLIGFSWTDSPIIAGVTTVRALHVADLRDALSQAYLAGGLAPPSFTANASLGATIAVASIVELRNAVHALE